MTQMRSPRGLSCEEKQSPTYQSLAGAIRWSAVFMAISVAVPCWAVGPKRDVPIEPPDHQAFPIRELVMGRVSAGSFKLPNDTTIDMSVRFDELAESEVNQSEKFTALRSGGIGVGRKTVLDVSLTSIEMDLVNFGVKVGYGPGRRGAGTVDLGTASGGIGSDVDFSGEITVKLGSMSMDLTVYDSDTKAAYGSVTTDSITAGVNLTFKVDFSDVSISPEVQFRTALAPALRAMVKQGMKSMISSSRINLIPWHALVKEVDLGAKLVLFDAGVKAGMAKGDRLSVYGSCSGSNCLERHLAEIKVYNVRDAAADGPTPKGYSEAKIVNDDGTQLSKLKPGDRVLISYILGF